MMLPARGPKTFFGMSLWVFLSDNNTTTCAKRRVGPKEPRPQRYNQANTAACHTRCMHFERPAFKTKEATWVLLTQLGSNTLLHFVAAKRLRSNECSFAALCTLASVHGSHCTEGHHGCTEIPWISGAEVLPASAGAFYGPRCIPQPASNMRAGIHFRLYSGRHSFSCAKIQRGLSQAPTRCTGIV